MFHKVNEDCEEALIEAGDYFLKFTHDGKTNEEHTIYVRPVNGSLADKSLSPFRFIPDFIENAFAQVGDLGLMVSSDSCEGCDLMGGDFQHADLGGNNLKNTNLSNANLSNANLYRADLDGADTTNTDFSGATAPNGGTHPSGSFGSPDLNSNEHIVTIINNCDEPVWAGIIFGDPAQSFLPVNGGPPLWGTGNTPSWEIKSMTTQTLNVPFGFKSAVITPRTGCVVDNMCCRDSNGAPCNVGTTCTQNSDCVNQFDTCTTKDMMEQCCTDAMGDSCNGMVCTTDGDCNPFDTCVTDIALRCEVGTCNDFNNCGTGGAGAEPATTFEMSLDQDQGAGHFADFYNVSMVAGNHIRAKVEPSDMTCPSVGVCESQPICPWNRVVQKQGAKIGITANYTVPAGGEVGVCLGPDKMVKNSRFSTLKEENPFENFKKDTDEFRRLGCVASEAPFTDKVCGATSLENIYYGCSPFAVNAEKHAMATPPPDGGEFGGCLSAFGPDSGCTLDNCHPTLLTPKGLNDNKMAYSVNQICDPYGQCDQARMKTAKWPAGTWPTGCTVPGCTPGDPVPSQTTSKALKPHVAHSILPTRTLTRLKEGRMHGSLTIRRFRGFRARLAVANRIKLIIQLRCVGTDPPENPSLL